MRDRRSRRMPSHLVTETQRSATEEAYLNSLRQEHLYSPSQNLGMSPEETARQHFLHSQAATKDLGMSPEETVYCQHAIDAAHSGKRQQAYELFCVLHANCGKRENVTILFWLAATTPLLGEAQGAVASIERLEPDHPSLPGLRQYVRKWEKKGVSGGKDHNAVQPARFRSEGKQQKGASGGKDRNARLLRGYFIIGIIIAAFMGLITLMAPPSSPIAPETPTEMTTPYGNSFTPNYPSRNGFTVECRDGTYSHAGGRRGACSYHGGETSHP